MTMPRRVCRSAGTLTALVLVGVAAGCASFRSPAKWGTPEKGGSTPPGAAATTANQTNDAAITKGDPERAVLAAVEEFLRNTDEYQVSYGAQPATDPWDARDKSQAARSPGRLQESRDLLSANVTSDEAPPTVSRAFANTQVALPSSSGATEPSRPIPIIQRVTARSADENPVAPPPPSHTTTPNQSLVVGESESALSAERILQWLRARAQQLRDLDSEWQLRVVESAFMFPPGEHSESVLTDEGKALLTGLLGVAEAVRQAVRDPSATAQEATERVESLRGLLADRADPGIPMIVLCSRVSTYGVYDEMAADSFVAGRSVQTIVYSELRNLRSALTEEGQFRTEVTTRLRLLTPGGDPVWEHEEPQIVDLCRRRRADFFIAQRVTFPASLPAGAYVLKLLVEDTVSGKAAEAMTDVVLHSPASLAATR